MHSSSFSIGSPVQVSRCGLLDLWFKFCIAFDEAMEHIEHIGGGDRLRVSAIRNDSSHLYSMECGFPLQIMIRVTDWNAKNTPAHLSARLYLNKKTGEVIGLVDDAVGVQLCRGDVDTAMKAISAELLKHLQVQATSAAA